MSFYIEFVLYMAGCFAVGQFLTFLSEGLI